MPLPVSSVKVLTTNAILPTTLHGRCPFYKETEAHRGYTISPRSQGWEWQSLPDCPSLRLGILTASASLLMTHGVAGRSCFLITCCPPHLSRVRGPLVPSPRWALSLLPSSQVPTLSLIFHYAFSVTSALPKSTISSVFLWS